MRSIIVRVVALAVVAAAPLSAQAGVTSPKERFGFDIGDDYQLANYSQLTDYWKTLAAESDRIKLVSIGKTAEGRDQWMAIITSPANHARLGRLREISARLSNAEGLTDEGARSLAAEGKAVIWIDGGLHATEVLGAQQLLEHVYQMVSRTDEETLRLLNDVVQLVVPANPDGMELVSNWYLRQPDPAARSVRGLPRLYHKYIGHDNNRDFYLNAMPESKNISRVMYREWYPQIMYNHHQTGPDGAVMFAPPFRDPHNHRLDPILISSLGMIGNAMHTRFAVENKPGVVQREAASYQTWWNGGLRTTAYFHNQVGILTETIGSPTPIAIPLVPGRLVADGNGPYPIMPQAWRFRQSIDYSITANRAILDYASRYREQLLYNIYLMGKSAIAKGGQDTWTITPKRVDAIRAAATPNDAVARLREPADRDPRGYVIPATQPDFLTATKFVNALIESGITVEAATAPFSAGGKQYPAGSYVIRTAQAFRAHVLDMMEPQDYPNDIPYPGGPPKAPYDNAGYTLALQMGIKFDRMLEGFACPCTRIPDVLSKPPLGATMPAGGPYLISRSVNDAYLAVNRVLAAKQVVQATRTEFIVPATATTTRLLRELVESRGLPVRTGRTTGAGLRPVRVGLWDQPGGSIASGWVRFILEQFEFPFEVVSTEQLAEAGLNQRFDALLFVSGAIPATVAGEGDRATVQGLRRFLESGGRVVAIGSSTSLARHLGLPVANHLVERAPDGTVRPLPRERFFVPASLLETAVDTTAPSAAGMESSAIVMFDRSPVLQLPPDAPAKGVRPVMWFPTAAPLRSGWAWGQSYLEGGVAAAEATVGKGTLYLYGPEMMFRSQPHGTFRMVFNGLLGK